MKYDKTPGRAKNGGQYPMMYCLVSTNIVLGTILDVYQKLLEKDMSLWTK